MQKKLQELTEKIYREGVEKANMEAEKILSEARKQAEKMLVEAEKNAEAHMKKAEAEAGDLRKNALNELQLAARQAVSDIKQQVAGLIQAKLIEPETKAAFQEVEFTKNIIQTVVENWDPKSGANVELEVLLPEGKQKEFEAYFKEKAKALLSSGLEVSFSDRIKGGFKIGPKDGSYRISFSDEDFNNFFKTYMRPRLIDMLFEKEAKSVEKQGE
ncbi:MAG: hypothetical protein RG741_03935 [Bacteroidales bacterium]|nr:hypothetical protein [Bacteroidales bacterium]